METNKTDGKQRLIGISEPVRSLITEHAERIRATRKENKWLAYESAKRRIDKAAASSEEYQHAMRALTKEAGL